MIKNKTQILKRCKKLAIEFNLKLLVLFGSYAKNEYMVYSDVDIAYYAKKPLSQIKKRNMRNKLSEIFYDKDIDLIELNTNYAILLRYEIFKDGICLYEENEGMFDEFESSSWFDYIDNKYYLNEYSDIVRKSIDSMIK